MKEPRTFADWLRLEIKREYSAYLPKFDPWHGGRADGLKAALHRYHNYDWDRGEDQGQTAEGVDDDGSQNGARGLRVDTRRK